MIIFESKKKFPSRLAQCSLRALLCIVVLTLSGCWLGELSTPRGVVQYRGLPANYALTNYMHVVQHLQQMGFRQVKPKSQGGILPLDSLFSEKSSGYFRDFIFDEKSNPYVISLQIDLNEAHSAIKYQFGEYERLARDRMKPLIKGTMSVEGCRVMTSVNEYIAAQLGKEYLAWDGVPCADD